MGRAPVAAFGPVVGVRSRCWGAPADRGRGAGRVPAHAVASPPALEAAWRGWAGLASLWGRRGAQDSRAGATVRVRRPPAGARARLPGARANRSASVRHQGPAARARPGARAHQVAPRARRAPRWGRVPPMVPPKVARRRQPRRSARARRPAVRVRRNAPTVRRPRSTGLRCLCRSRPSARICQRRASHLRRCDVNMPCPKRQAR
jgi:hypothetical protein